jgi:HJR/Mrr/RecB family endonuclease
VLTEDMVCDAVSAHLTGRGWRIVSRARGRSPGVDIVAEHDGVRLEVEAKGAG